MDVPPPPNPKPTPNKEELKPMDNPEQILLAIICANGKADDELATEARGIILRKKSY
jgi:hypothetical protein